MAPPIAAFAVDFFITEDTENAENAEKENSNRGRVAHTTRFWLCGNASTLHIKDPH